MSNKIILKQIKKSDISLKQKMSEHYSKPKGFVGRQIIYEISYKNIIYGYIAGGSATLYLPGRNEFFNITKNDIQKIINNTFFHIEKQNNQYPFHNFAQKVLQQFEKQIYKDWKEKYNIECLGIETLVELPRTGEIYRRENYILVGQTKGYTCKREAGKGTDTWSGKRVWNTKELRPKLVFCKKYNVT